jgi:hypothetical protein
MLVRTRQRFPTRPDRVWPLLLDARMDGTGSPLFRLGVPEPVLCRLPDPRGGVGAERECVSDRGVVHQRIVRWEPGRRLEFRMEASEVASMRSIQGMADRFDLVADGSGTLVTRTTQVELQGPWACPRNLLVLLGLKGVHRYVFRNWLRLSEQPLADGGTLRGAVPGA